jgi:lipopolysaccharide cholinephosphotransferase
MEKNNSKGLMAFIQKAAQKIVGIREWRKELDTLQDEVDSLHYFLNAYHDCSSAPPASDPDLRIMQLCDAELLRITTRECEALGMTYWLDYGTLLGAVRHKGFIPWDDDMDIAMPRKDYNRVYSELKGRLNQYGIEIYDNSGNIGVGYEHSKTGIWLDIFAVDDFYTDKGLEETTAYLKEVVPQYRKVFEGNTDKVSIEWLGNKREAIIGGTTGALRFLYHQPEFRYKAIVHPERIIYPLSKIVFEGISFNAPNDPVSYLRVNYGDNYWGFPKTGVLHHDRGRGALSSWAKNNRIDMNDVLSYLRGI